MVDYVYETLKLVSSYGNRISKMEIENAKFRRNIVKGCLIFGLISVYELRVLSNRIDKLEEKLKEKGVLD